MAHQRVVTIKYRRKKSNPTKISFGGYETCRVCNGTGLQKTPSKKK